MICFALVLLLGGVGVGLRQLLVMAVRCVVGSPIQQVGSTRDKKVTVIYGRRWYWKFAFAHTAHMYY